MPGNYLDRAKAFLRGRRQVYIQTFKNPVGEHVLRDLAKFCRAHASTFHSDASVSDRLDGRREVWLRIQQHLQLTDDELWSLYGQSSQPRGQSNE